ncbi:unnamed protein product [Brassica oleracea var. botrytis]
MIAKLMAWIVVRFSGVTVRWRFCSMKIPEEPHFVSRSRHVAALKEGVAFMHVILIFYSVGLRHKLRKSVVMGLFKNHL